MTNSNNDKKLAKAHKKQEIVNLAVLLNDIYIVIMSYVILSPEQAVAITLWVAHTHTIKATEITIYLAIYSVVKRCGKTTLLEILSLIVANPWFTGRITAAVLSRKVDQDCPTLLLDESDSAFSGDKEYTETLRGVLNTGHRRSGKVTCCIGQGASIGFRDFSTFCAKAIAGIGKLPDTIADRSVPIVLKRRTAKELVKRFRQRDATLETIPIREKLAQWSDQAISILTDARPEIPASLSDRAADGWEALLAIADLAGGDWPERSRRAAILLSAGTTPEDDSLGIRLLSDIKAIITESGKDRIDTSNLLEKLNSIDEAPWGDYYGKPITSRQLAKWLKPFGIVPHTIRTNLTTLKGYLAIDFHDAWSRYLPQPSITASQTEIEYKKTSEIEPENIDVTDSTLDTKQENSDFIVTDVTVSKAEIKVDKEIDKSISLTSVEKIIGMQVKEAIQLWKSEGSQEICLGNGKTCKNLEAVLTNADIDPQDLERITFWLNTKRFGGRM